MGEEPALWRLCSLLGASLGPLDPPAPSTIVHIMGRCWVLVHSVTTQPAPQCCFREVLGCGNEWRGWKVGFGVFHFLPEWFKD